MKGKETTADSDIKARVREQYAEIIKARGGLSCCGLSRTQERAKSLGYTQQDLAALPQACSSSLGCGNPVSVASLKPGETVLDLGSGAGLDVFLAAKAVGKEGKALGVDMTPEMVKQARENAQREGYTNVEFKLGEIEALPLPDASVDVVISNCVINLSPEKERVFQEVYRVLKPGGRLIISDIVLLKPLPASIKENIEAYVGCVGGACLKQDYLSLIQKVGLRRLEILASRPVELSRRSWARGLSGELTDAVESITVLARKDKKGVALPEHLR